MTKKETHGSSETRKLLLNNDLLSDLIMESMSRQNSRMTLIDRFEVVSEGVDLLRLFEASILQNI